MPDRQRSRRHHGTNSCARYLVMYPFQVALALFDRRTLGKLHPATLVSLALLLPVQLSGAWIARSDRWDAVAPALVGPPI